MEFKNIHLRYKLKNGDVAVCRLDDCNWNQTNMCLGIYYNGQFYDIQVKEHGQLMPDISWILTYDDGETFVKDFCFTGENVKDIISPINI